MSSFERSLRYPIKARPHTRLERLLVSLGTAGLIRCTVCGGTTWCLALGENLRETGRCFRCSSFNRQRQLAWVLCRAYGCRSLRQLARRDDLQLYNAEAHGAVHAVLRSMTGYRCSEYFGPGLSGGELVDGVPHEDLMELSFASESLDVVLSADVFEHVPEPYRAHREVHRVLRPGGRHVFTVPFHQEEFLDEPRAVRSPDGEIEYLAEPVYHSDPLNADGVLVYNIFGLEMLIELRRIGFRTYLYQLYSPLRGIYGCNGIVFEAVKA